VTFGEYESALRWEHECVSGLGVVVDPLELTADGTFAIGWETSAQGDEFDRLYDKSLRCHDKVDAIAAVYVLGNAATEQELKDAERDFRSCLASTLLSGVEGKPVGQLATELQEYVEDGRIERSLAEACIGIVQTVSAQPLPGLQKALDELDLG